MLGIIVLISISWLLLHLIERKSLTALGFFPIKERLIQFALGFLVSGVICCCIQYLDAYLKFAKWDFNDAFSSSALLKSSWWDFKSVLTEELIFRGALLYILIQRLGTSKSLFISAIAFGVYHWFSFGVLGNLIAMAIVLVGTGIMGYAWAWTFSKTKSLMMPLGFHLGWNFVHNTIFSKGPLGDTLFIISGGQELSDARGLLSFLIAMILAPIFTLLYVKYFIKQDEKS